MSLFLRYAWIIPLITGLVFLAGLIALLASWAAEGYPRYQPNEGSIVYVSDVGAHLKALFITICSITAPGFVLTHAIDRFFRHRGRLAPDYEKREKRMSWLSMVFAIIGGIALILLSVFDSFTNSKTHWTMAAVFIVCIATSAICQTVEFKWLNKEYEGYYGLRISYILKLITVVPAVSLAVVMGILMAKHSISAAAVCEWLISFIFGFYIFLMVYDLRPAVRTSNNNLEDQPLEPADVGESEPTK